MPTDAERRARLLEIAKVELKGTALFRGASWRLMSDFVAAVGELHTDGSPRRFEQFELIVVLEGRVRARFDSGAPLVLDRGVYFAHQLGLVAPRLELLEEEHQRAAAYVITSNDFERIKESWALARSLDLAGLPDGPGRGALASAIELWDVEFNLVAFADALLAWESARKDVPGYLFQQLVVAAVSRSPGVTLSVTLGRDSELHLVEEWRGRSPTYRVLGEQAVRDLYIERENTRDGNDQRLPPLDRFYVSYPNGAPEQAWEQMAGWWQARRDFLPADLPPMPEPPKARLHRIVYLSEHPEQEVPDALVDLFHDTVGPVPGLFNSLVRVALRSDPLADRDAPPPSPASDGLGGELRAALGAIGERAARLLERRSRFEARPVLPPRRSGAELRLLQRDAARISLDPSRVLMEFRRHLRSAWDPFDPFLRPPFAPVVFDSDASVRTTAATTGRALTVKRVGVAVSGGGASAFRIGPLLELLEDPQFDVPVDFYAGVSGGALVGAYYCALKSTGVQLLVDRMQCMKWVVPLLPLSSWALEAWVDGDLEGRRVEDLLDTRFLAVSVELDGAAPPLAVTVVSGTLGEAVRASGSMPIVFGPTEKNGARYADGAGAMIVPATVLGELGADVILACDAVPGPRRSNPWHDVPGMDFLHRFTPLGRAIDAWSWMAFMLQNAAYFSAKGADVYLQFERDDIPLREALEWGRAAQIVDEARNDPRVTEAAWRLSEIFKAPP